MTCKNGFLEEDGYCTQCGQNHWKNQKKRSYAPPAPSAKEKTNENKETQNPTSRRPVSPGYRPASGEVQPDALRELAPGARFLTRRIRHHRN